MSWLTTLLGAAVLTVFGFGIGMLVGGLWEAPDLVFHYLTGGTEEVALAPLTSRPVSAVANSALVVAGEAHSKGLGSEAEARDSPGLPPGGATPGPAGRSERGSRAPLPAVAAPAPDPSASQPSGQLTRVAVQVGAFAESRAAEKLAAALREKGYSVYLSPGVSSGDARWRVRVGPLSSAEDARRTASRLKTEEKLPTWVLKEDG